MTLYIRGGKQRNRRANRADQQQEECAQPVNRERERKGCGPGQIQRKPVTAPKTKAGNKHSSQQSHQQKYRGKRPHSLVAPEQQSDRRNQRQRSQERIECDLHHREFCRAARKPGVRLSLIGAGSPG